jgi:patatin-like phospholipase/acyl hydrolase
MMATAAGTSSATLQETNGEQTLDNTGHCLLALDGGGVRGLSTLYILQNIMGRLNYERGETGLQPRKPCELFDLIGGTSTGGYVKSKSLKIEQLM